MERIFEPACFDAGISSLVAVSEFFLVRQDQAIACLILPNYTAYAGEVSLDNDVRAY